MTDIPIRSVEVSDFRRIEGTRVLPFDAPVVLIHGSNGTGKTSILSALELGLTGEVRSMKRQDDRYAAHLPFLGQPYATVRVNVADYLQAGSNGVPLTVNGARIDGVPALTDHAAKFYSERCYLDQASLGRLLELYQYREPKGESALARFVNELLGLEKLDALRTGLHDATDLRLLKKLARGVDDAADKAKAAATELADHSATLADARNELRAARAATVEAFEALHPGASDGLKDTELVQFVRTTLENESISIDVAAATSTHEELIALGGRISALSERPSMQRIADARGALGVVTSDREAWTATHGAAVAAWDAAAKALGEELLDDRRDDVRKVAILVHSELEANDVVRAQAEAASVQLAAARAELDQVQTRLADVREHSSALIESLVALRSVVQDDVCPVCDRDFAETGQVGLPKHIDAKLTKLTAHGQQLGDLRDERDHIVARVARFEVEVSQLNARLLSSSEQSALKQRHASLVELVRQLDALEPAIAAGREIDQRERDARSAVGDLETASSEDRRIRAELSRYGDLLGTSLTVLEDSPHRTWQQLFDRAVAEVTKLKSAAESYRVASTESARLAAAIERETAIGQKATVAAQRQTRWEACVTEAIRRQVVAKEVHEAATRARTTVVQRVFTENLNDVWRSVFTRLAPNEGFIPSFGIPTATKTALDIKLETTDPTGEASGSPQMMLSAGNLNTAALSLFLALHLAVDPMVPCLVFDDPVQAMDEVHVAQFAGLIRVLAKQHQRQVVIAVHERELFDYLALELSPAYEGDELLTIELGERADDNDQGVTRHTWTPDRAIAS